MFFPAPFSSSSSNLGIQSYLPPPSSGRKMVGRNRRLGLVLKGQGGGGENFWPIFPPPWKWDPLPVSALAIDFPGLWRETVVAILCLVHLHSWKNPETQKSHNCFFSIFLASCAASGGSVFLSPQTIGTAMPCQMKEEESGEISSFRTLKGSSDKVSLPLAGTGFFCEIGNLG